MVSILKVLLNQECVKKGQPILTVDFDKVKEAGCDIVTPIIVTNTSEYVAVVAKDEMTEATPETMIIYVI